MTLLHDANLMGWRVGDRVGISSDEPMATGEGEEFTILAISDRGTITLDRPAANDFDVTFVPPREGQTYPALMSPEVVNLSRNIVITGDDYEHIGCDPNLPEVIPVEESSTLGCRCASYRTKCTVGWHSIAMNGGSARYVSFTFISRPSHATFQFLNLGRLLCDVIPCQDPEHATRAVRTTRHRGQVLSSLPQARELPDLSV